MLEQSLLFLTHHLGQFSKKLSCTYTVKMNRNRMQTASYFYAGSIHFYQACLGEHLAGLSPCLTLFPPLLLLWKTGSENPFS